MSALILEPTVRIVAWSRPNVDGMVRWFEENGYLEVESISNGEGNKATDMIDQILGTVESCDLDNIIEFGGRQCYRSFQKGRDQKDYIHNILEMKHGSVIAHTHVSFAITGISRSLSHELVRHAIGAAYSQESQRYVDASDVKFVVPPKYLGFYNRSEVERERWEEKAEIWIDDYMQEQAILKEVLGQEGYTGRKLVKKVNEAARHVLPNAAETRILATYSARAIRHILDLRGSSEADEEIARLAVYMAREIEKTFPNSYLFDDMEIGEDNEITFEHTKV